MLKQVPSANSRLKPSEHDTLYEIRSKQTAEQWIEADFLCGKVGSYFPVTPLIGEVETKCEERHDIFRI